MHLTRAAVTLSVLGVAAAVLIVSVLSLLLRRGPIYHLLSTLFE